MKTPIRVLIVDDSAFIRRALRRMLADAPDIHVVGAAVDGREGVERVLELEPDVVLLDINMPEMDGIEAIREIMDRKPTPILVLSDVTRPGADVALRALELGAVDFVSKSDANTRLDIYDLASVLKEKIRATYSSRVPSAAPRLPRRPEASSPPAPTDQPGPSPVATPYELIAIGASTGGPRALAQLLGELPGGFHCPIVIAQHMPVGFTHTMAARLDRRSVLRVEEAQDGQRIEPGSALVGPGGSELTVERSRGQLVARVSHAPDRVSHRPSVDRLFDSVARVVGRRAIGLVLTGMGRDGARGLQAIREAGGYTLAESSETAVIDGMPAAARPAAEAVLPLHEITPRLANICRHQTEKSDR